MIGLSVVPICGGSSRREKDVVTPHSISIILFIERYAKLRPKYWDHHRPPECSNVQPEITPQQRKATCRMTVRLTQGGDLVLSELMQLLESGQLVELHVTSFMTALHEIYCNGIDSLLNLFDSVEKFINQDQKDQSRAESFPCLWSSVVGLYLRRLNLSFRRLGFSQVTSLYQRFRLYYEECYTSHPNHLHQADVEMCGDGESTAEELDTDAKMEDMIDVGKEEEEDLRVWSPVPAISSSTAPPDHLPQLPTPREEERTPPGHSTRQQAELFISQQTSLLQFSETAALSPPQLQTKIKQLVKQNPDLGEAHYLSYLNCLRVKEYCGAMHSLLRTYDGHLVQRDSSRGEDTGRGFRYAALNLAALHAQFDHKKTALAVLKEAIRLAQESSDHVCLQHALAWLYTLLPCQKIQLMRRSTVKSCELSLGYLSSLGRLNHAAQLVHTQTTPAHLLRSIVRSESLNCQHSLVSLQHGSWGLRAALWATWGECTMTGLASQVLLNLNTHHPTNPATFYSAQPTCAAICNIAMALANLGEYQLAGQVVQEAQQRFPPHTQHSSTWMFTAAHITFMELLHQGRWTQAQAALTNMATTQPAQAKLRQCELLVAQGELTQAWHLLGELYHQSDVTGELRVRLLLVASCAMVAGGGGAAAVPVLVEALTTATKYHLTYLAALTHLHTANVQLQLGLLREAEQSLNAGLGQVLAGGSVYDQARARLLHAKLKVSQARSKERVGKLLETALSLDLVTKLFTKVRAYQKVRETLYLKTRLYHEVGYVEERNKCALEFRQFELQQPCQAFHSSINSF